MFNKFLKVASSVAEQVRETAKNTANQVRENLQNHSKSHTAAEVEERMKNEILECRTALQFVNLFGDWVNAIHMSDSPEAAFYVDEESEDSPLSTMTLSFRQVFLRSRALQRVLIQLASLPEVRNSFMPPCETLSGGGKAWPSLLELLSKSLIKQAFQSDHIQNVCVALLTTPIHHEGCIKWLSALIVTMIQDWQDDAFKAERARLQAQAEDLKSEAGKPDIDNEKRRVMSRELVNVYAKLGRSLTKAQERRHRLQEQGASRLSQVQKALERHTAFLSNKTLECSQAKQSLRERQEQSAEDANKRLETLVLNTKGLETQLKEADAVVAKLKAELAAAEIVANKLRGDFDSHELKIAGIRMELETTHHGLQLKYDTACSEGESADEERLSMSGFESKLDHVEAILTPALKQLSDEVDDKAGKWEVFLQKITVAHLDREEAALAIVRAETETALKSMRELEREEADLGSTVRNLPNAQEILPTETSADAQRRIRMWHRYTETRRMLLDARTLVTRCIESEATLWSQIDGFLRNHNTILEQGNSEGYTRANQLRDMHSAYILEFGPIIDEPVFQNASPSAPIATARTTHAIPAHNPVEASTSSLPQHDPVASSFVKDGPKTDNEAQTVVTTSRPTSVPPATFAIGDDSDEDDHSEKEEEKGEEEFDAFEASLNVPITTTNNQVSNSIVEEYKPQISKVDNKESAIIDKQVAKDNDGDMFESFETLTTKQLVTSATDSVAPGVSPAQKNTPPVANKPAPTTASLADLDFDSFLDAPVASTATNNNVVNDNSVAKNLSEATKKIIDDSLFDL